MSILIPFGKVANGTTLTYYGKVKLGKFFLSAVDYQCDGKIVTGSCCCSGYSSAQLILGGKMQDCGEARIWIKDDELVSVS